MRAATAKIQAEVCLTEHPVLGVLCLRNIGHPGLHWFQVRWLDAHSAIATARDAVRRAIEGDA